MTNALEFEYPHFLLEDSPFIPVIFDGGLSETVPKEFNSVRIPIDGTLTSELKWTEALERAEEHTAKGLKILWDLDLGLFKRLSLPLSDESQFQALKLSLSHFCESIWQTYAPHSLGVCLYRGPLDISQNFPWDPAQREMQEQWSNHNNSTSETLFVRDAAADYLHLLCTGLPGNLQPFLAFDASRHPSLYPIIELLHREIWDGFYPIIRGTSYWGAGLGWDSGNSNLGTLTRQLASSLVAVDPQIALAIPSPELMLHTSTRQQLEAVTLSLKEKPFRVITEAFLTSEWHGLDQLVVVSDSVSTEMLRKLKGFCAAGGTVITYGPLLGLAQEINHKPL